MSRIAALFGSPPGQPALQTKVVWPLECTPNQIGNQIADHSAQNGNKQAAIKVFHDGPALRIGHTQILLSRLEQRPLVGFPDHCPISGNDRSAGVSHSEISSRPAKRQALNTPTYCKETGRRIGVCACPKCVPVPPKEQQ